jgi:hypothetical protein
LIQFEEQMTAASVVTHATRPINLYYAMTQAGLAISAVRTPGTYSFTSHGIKVVHAGAELPEIVVQRDTEKQAGGYQMVSGAVGSELIESGVSVLGLWSILPELTETMAFPDSKHPECLPLSPDEPSAWRSNRNDVSEIKPPSGSIFIYAPPRADQVTNEWLADLLKNYPGTTGCYLLKQPREHDPKFARMAIDVCWPSPEPTRNLTEQEISDFFDTIAPLYRYRSDRYLRPSIDPSGKSPPSPFMSWWLLLYTFSMLARYQPVKWVKLLDLDKSKYAAVLQYTLQQAQISLPRLVVEALTGNSYLDAKPMMIWS